jgi:hypothetical protein
MTPGDIVAYINAYASTNQYIELLRSQTMDKFWTKYILRDQLLAIFTDSQSAAIFNNRNLQLIYLFDTKLNAQNEEYIAYVGHNPHS